MGIPWLACFQSWALESTIFTTKGTRLTPQGTRITSHVWEGTKAVTYHLTANFPLPLLCFQAFLCGLYIYQNFLCLYHMNLKKNSGNANTGKSYYKYLSNTFLFSVPHICSHFLSWHSFYLRSQDKGFTFSYHARNFIEST